MAPSNQSDRVTRSKALQKERSTRANNISSDQARFSSGSRTAKKYHEVLDALVALNPIDQNSEMLEQLLEIWDPDYSDRQMSLQSISMKVLYNILGSMEPRAILNAMHDGNNVIRQLITREPWILIGDRIHSIRFTHYGPEDREDVFKNWAIEFRKFPESVPLKIGHEQLLLCCKKLKRVVRFESNRGGFSNQTILALPEPLLVRAPGELKIVDFIEFKHAHEISDDVLIKIKNTTGNRIGWVVGEWSESAYPSWIVSHRFLWDTIQGGTDGEEAIRIYPWIGALEPNEEISITVTHWPDVAKEVLEAIEISWTNLDHGPDSNEAILYKLLDSADFHGYDELLDRRLRPSEQKELAFEFFHQELFRFYRRWFQQRTSPHIYIKKHKVVIKL